MDIGEVDDGWEGKRCDVIRVSGTGSVEVEDVKGTWRYLSLGASICCSMSQFCSDIFMLKTSSVRVCMPA